MKEKLLLSCFFLVSLISLPVSTFAFGEVAGTVVFHTSAGGSGTENWGIFNNESITVSISADGDAAKYIAFPQTVTLPAGNKIYYVPITANIPSDYDLSQGTNIAGQLYALVQGSPGQVRINLQLEKNFQIIVQQQTADNQNSGTLATSQASNNPSTSTVATVSNSIPSNVIQSTPDVVNSMQKVSGFVADLFAFQPTSIAIALGLIFLIGIIYFAMKRNGGE